MSIEVFQPEVNVWLRAAEYGVLFYLYQLLWNHISSGEGSESLERFNEFVGSIKVDNNLDGE